MIIVKEFNEFTWDMVRTFPRVNFFLETGKNVQVVCKKNLESLYQELTPNVISEDRFNPYNDNSTYNHNRPPFTLENWLPPNLKDKWKNYLIYDKPTIVVQNIYTLEWTKGPFNYFSVEFLDEFFETFKYKYQILYIRPESNRKDYYTDENKILSFGDYDLIKNNHPEVITIKDVMEKHSELNFNTAQFAMHATSNKHISPSGGNACLSAYFGGDLFIFDTYNGMGPLRGIWKTDSWLKDLGGSKIYGYSQYEELFNKIKEKWLI
jgi:hypothetical protein